MIDARAMRFETLRYGWDEANPLSGREPCSRSRRRAKFYSQSSAPEIADVLDCWPQADDWSKMPYFRRLTGHRFDKREA